MYIKIFVAIEKFTDIVVNRKLIHGHCKKSKFLLAKIKMSNLIIVQKIVKLLIRAEVSISKVPFIVQKISISLI